MAGIEAGVDPLLTRHLELVVNDPLVGEYTKRTTLKTGKYTGLFGMPKLKHLRMFIDEIADLGLVRTVVPKREETNVGNNKAEYFTRAGVGAIAALIYMYRQEVSRGSVTIPIPWQELVLKTRLALGENEISQYIRVPKPEEIENQRVRKSMSDKFPGPKLGRPPAVAAAEKKEEPEESRGEKIGLFMKADLEELIQFDRNKIRETLEAIRTTGAISDSIDHKVLPQALEKSIKVIMEIYLGKPPINYEHNELLNHGQAAWGLNIFEEGFKKYPQCNNALQILWIILSRAKLKKASSQPDPKI